MNAVAKRSGWSKFEVRCPTCGRRYTLTQEQPDSVSDDAGYPFRLFDNGEAVQLYPDFVCRTRKCDFTGPIVMAPAK